MIRTWNSKVAEVLALISSKKHSFPLSGSSNVNSVLLTIWKIAQNAKTTEHVEIILIGPGYLINGVKCKVSSR